MAWSPAVAERWLAATQVKPLKLNSNTSRSKAKEQKQEDIVLERRCIAKRQVVLVLMVKRGYLGRTQGFLARWMHAWTWLREKVSLSCWARNQNPSARVRGGIIRRTSAARVEGKKRQWSQCDRPGCGGVCNTPEVLPSIAKWSSLPYIVHP